MSRLIGANAADEEAAIRRDAVRRWREAIRNGLSVTAAAKAVGVPCATLYRWEIQPEPRSCRPHRLRQPRWSPPLVEAVEQLRLDNPMWGKRKLAVLFAREGFTVSVSAVGRILARLVARGVVIAVPILRRKPGGRRFRFTHKQRHARRCPRVSSHQPLVSSSRSTRCSSTSLQVSRSSTSPLRSRPIRGIQVDGGSEFKAEFEATCQCRNLNLFVFPPKRPQLNGAVERNQGSWRYEFYESYDLPHQLDQLQPLVDAFANRFNHVSPTMPSTFSPLPSTSLELLEETSSRL